MTRPAALVVAGLASGLLATALWAAAAPPVTWTLAPSALGSQR